MNNIQRMIWYQIKYKNLKTEEINDKLFMGDAHNLTQYFERNGLETISIKKMYDYERKFHLSCLID